MMKASLWEANLPSSLPPHLNMASRSPLFLFATLFLFHLGGGLPALAQDTSPLTSSSSNYQRAPVNTILDLYEQLCGKHLIRDANLDGSAIVVSLNATGLSKPELMKLIEQVLLLNGVAIIPIDDHNLKVITIGTNKNARSEGVKLYANATDLPATEEIVSYYMPLNYINPQEAVQIFSQVAPFHAYGAYVPAPSAQAIVLTENVSVIRQLIALKELIDAPPAHVVSKWIQLNRADADKVADILNKMLGIGPNGASLTPPGPGGAVIVPAGLGAREPLSNEKNLISGSAQIVADAIANRVFIITRPVNMPFLEQIIAELDKPDIFMVPQRRPLKYVLAQDILPALEAALARGKDEEDQVKKDAQAAQAAQTKTGGSQVRLRRRQPPPRAPVPAARDRSPRSPPS